MTAHLDPNPARCDLTSRECCKLLCGIGAGMVGTGVPIEVMRRMFGVIHLVARGGTADLDDVNRLSSLIEGLELSLPDMIAVRHSMTLLGAVMGAIAEQALPGALETAIDWINETDQVWQTAFGTLPLPPKGSPA